MPRNDQTIRVLVVEDDAPFRETVVSLLTEEPTMHVAGDYGSVEEALADEAVQADVVLLDINLPGCSGVDGIGLLRPRLPDAEFLMLSVIEQTEVIFEALKAGASGYLSKRATPDEIVAAVTDVREGGSPMSSAIARKVIASFRKPTSNTDALAVLTMRENQILTDVARGSLDKEIALAQGISLSTVKTHLRSIYQKLRVQNRTEATRRYLEND